MNAIAADEKIEPSDADLAQELEKMKKSNPGREADVEKYFNEKKKNIASSMKEEKLFKFLLDNGKVKEETK
jgi:FKBP-type peptidyl-prolyl cis-trans isomerase (trigger factor)